ncbi:ribonuclease R, partial [Deinococcus sp. MIMF12]
MTAPQPREPEAPAPVKPARRGRQPRAAAVAEPTPEPLPLPPVAGSEAAAVIPAEAPARPRRGPKTKTATPVAEAAEPQPDMLPPVASEPTDPVLLEVPKARRGRKAKSAAAPAPEAAEAPLDEVLGGVESVEVEDDTPAPGTPDSAPVHTRMGDGQSDTPEPLIDLPHETEDGQENHAGTEARGQEPGDPARAMVVAQLRKLGRPIHVRDLERTFTRQMQGRLGDWRDLESLLDDLTRTGDVIRTRKRTYGLPEAMNLVRGRFQASAAGFGFVVPDSGGEDYYVAAEHTMEAWNGDIVLVRMEGRGDSGRGGGPRRGQRGDGSPRASVVRIVQRAYKQLVGTLEFSKGHPILKPDDHRARHRILLLPQGIDELHSGARVVAELFWPEGTGEDEVFGQVTRVLGEQDDPETETEAVIVKYGLRGDFPEDVLEQADAVPTQIPAEALVGRLDLREFNIFTVDGRDAKDFDDAIHIQPTPEGTFVVGVHIADVSHYVTDNSPLDKEAYARATSVYLPGRVLPMLPEHLSNGVCSLVPYEDRLTLTALVELSAEGDILKVQLAPSVIQSKARLTYDEVQAYSEATATLPDHARQLEGDLHLLLKITTKLRQKRLREGSLDFKLREVKVDVGKDGRMELIPIREETARGMIEDLMLLANKVVANELLKREIPALFRIHEEPTLQKFQEVTAAIARLGISFPGGEPTPQAYQAVLKGVRGTPRESVVNTLLLRSMQQAKYAGENLGHFGLAFDEYLHFTSPIRRYPDLLVHRVLKGMLSGELRASSRAVNDLRAKLPAMGEHTSERERAASEAERDLTKYYQAKWAQEHLGETFAGNVSGVVSSGLFVALDNGVEGKLHISNLDDDYYIYLEDAQMLRGRSNGRNFRLGDSVTVTISQVNPLARQIDFTQETDMEGNPIRPRARRREDREAEKREKLQTVSTAAPRKFTLDDPQPASPAPRPVRGPQQGQSGPEGRDRDRGGRPAASSQSPQSGGRGGRRVITLERPRNEHLRPVNITVQRMYFGDWTVENLPPDEGGQGEGGRSGGRRFGQDGRGGDRGGRGPGYSRGSSD